MHRRDRVRLVRQPEELRLRVHPHGRDEAAGEIEHKGPDDGHGDDFAQAV